MIRVSAGFALYMWFASVHHAPGVKRRKAERRARYWERLARVEAETRMLG